MAIDTAAYLKVGLGCVPDDMKREMLEKREDTTAEWRLPAPEERDQLSQEHRRLSGLALTAADVARDRFTGARELDERFDQNSDNVDLYSVAKHPAFKRFAEIVMQMEVAVSAETGLDACIEDLEDLEMAMEDAEFASVAEKKFIRAKIGGAKAQAHRAYVKNKRSDSTGFKKHARQTARWKKTHQSKVKRMAKTARPGYRRSDADMPEANLNEARGPSKRRWVGSAQAGGVGPGGKLGPWHFAKTDWLRKMQAALLKHAPKAAGKIDWDTAIHLFNVGDSPEEAAKKMAKTLGEGYTGRMQQVSDSHYDIDDLRRLAGLTESKHSAAYSTQIMDSRRPRSPMTEAAVDQDLSEFQKLAGIRWR